MSTTENQIRVRFAPSPTGFLHVGSARTALYNWLYARQNAGVFVLRIEDTDKERNRQEWDKAITESLEWLGLNFDEGPYRQSERTELYRNGIDQLIAQGKTYYCDCTREELEKRTEGKKPGYDGFCRDRGLEKKAGLALRFRVDGTEPVVVQDIIRGDVVFERSAIEDFVIVKGNDDPLFVLANVIDDCEMRISHIIRGEDLLPTTPKALLLWECLSNEPLPKFAHLPMLVNEKRQKLSKRRDPVAIEEYRNSGFLPEVICGYLAILGWSPKDGREMLALDELIEQFSLEDVNHSPAFFDVVKLTHFNGEMIRSLSLEDFIERSSGWVGDNWELSKVTKLIPLVQERVSKLSEIAPMLEFMYEPEIEVDPDTWSKAIEGNPNAKSILQYCLEQFRECDWDSETLKEILLTVGDKVGLKLGKAQAPVRVAVSGSTVGLPLFESLEALGRIVTSERIAKVLAKIQ